MIIRCYFCPRRKCSALSPFHPPPTLILRLWLRIRHPHRHCPRGQYPPAPTISGSPTGTSPPSLPGHALSPCDGSPHALLVVIAGHYKRQWTLAVRPANWMTSQLTDNGLIDWLSDWLTASTDWLTDILALGSSQSSTRVSGFNLKWGGGGVIIVEDSDHPLWWYWKVYPSPSVCIPPLPCTSACATTPYLQTVYIFILVTPLDLPSVGPPWASFIFWSSLRPYMVITRPPLPQNNGDLPLTLFWW